MMFPETWVAFIRCGSYYSKLTHHSREVGKVMKEEIFTAEKKEKGDSLVAKTKP